MHDADPLTEQGRAAFGKYYKDLRTWQKEAGAIALAGGRMPKRPSLPGIAGMWRGPSQFFNGKIAPVVPYAIRGAIWCQGTSNGGDGRIYAARMEALVKRLIPKETSPTTSPIRIKPITPIIHRFLRFWGAVRISGSNNFLVDKNSPGVSLCDLMT